MISESLRIDRVVSSIVSCLTLLERNDMNKLAFYFAISLAIACFLCGGGRFIAAGEVTITVRIAKPLPSPQEGPDSYETVDAYKYMGPPFIPFKKIKMPGWTHQGDYCDISTHFTPSGAKYQHSHKNVDFPIYQSNDGGITGTLITEEMVKNGWKRSMKVRYGDQEVLEVSPSEIKFNYNCFSYGLEKQDHWIDLKPGGLVIELYDSVDFHKEVLRQF